MARYNPAHMNAYVNSFMTSLRVIGFVMRDATFEAYRDACAQVFGVEPEEVVRVYCTDKKTLGVDIRLKRPEIIEMEVRLVDG